MYFTQPSQLLDIFTEMEESNLFLIQNGQVRGRGRAGQPCVVNQSITQPNWSTCLGTLHARARQAVVGQKLARSVQTYAKVVRWTLPLGMLLL